MPQPVEIGIQSRVAELRNLLTPALLKLVVQIWVPLPAHGGPGSIDFNEVVKVIFSNDQPRVQQHHDTIWPVLKAISEVPLHPLIDSSDDMTAFLPAPGDPSYPEHSVCNYYLTRRPELSARVSTRATRIPSSVLWPSPSHVGYETCPTG
jgi:hypothetical protein